MWYKLNEMMGIILLIAVVGGAAIYGLILFIEAPPLLRQEGDPPSAYELQARKDLEKRIRGLQDRQAEVLKEAAEFGR